MIKALTSLVQLHSPYWAFGRLDQKTFHAFEFTSTPQDFEYMTIIGLVNRLANIYSNNSRVGPA